MAKNLYVLNTEPRSGKSAICLGLMQMLRRHIRKVGFFRPVINARVENKIDHDIHLILKTFQLAQPAAQAYAYTLDEARELINQGKHRLLMENILSKYKALEQNYDFIVCEGTDVIGSDPAFEYDINAEIAANLSSPVVLVANGLEKSPKQIVAQTRLSMDTFTEKGVDILAVIINRASNDDKGEILSGLHCKFTEGQECLRYVIPEISSLSKPSMKDVHHWLGGEIISGEKFMEVQVEEYLVAAMQVNNFLDHVSRNCLVITPGDRSDVLLGCFSTRQSHAYPEIAGIVLTGGMHPPESILKLMRGWAGVPMPVLVVEGHTFKIASTLTELYGRIDPEDEKKVATALGSFDDHVDTGALLTRLEAKRSTKVTPIMFQFSLLEKAKADRKHIVLPEGASDRILHAADILLRRGIVDLTILGQPDTIRARATQMGLNLNKAQLLDPVFSEFFEDYTNTYHALRKDKGVTAEVARDNMSDPTWFGTMMVYKDHAHGMVSGAITTTQQTIRPALQFIRTKPGISLVSSVFFMCLPDRVLVFGDCAVNPSPTSEQLAHIAVSAARTSVQFGVAPRVAMLSYSTGSSGSGEEVQKVRRATQIAQSLAPQLMLEGPLQYDAAYDPAVARTKMPESKIAGRATVFIFPDLNTGNNTYKAVQRAANAVAIGPVLQGLNKPVNDLSRGCTVPDILNTVAITAIQAQDRD
jgi:phosphate acetyltransferase